MIKLHKFINMGVSIRIETTYSLAPYSSMLKEFKHITSPILSDTILFRGNIERYKFVLTHESDCI